MAVAILGLAAPGLAASACGGPEEGGVRVAVAANFAEAHEAIAAGFTEATGIPVVTSVGSTGQLATQALNGAPFDVFLAADTARPRLLEAAGSVAPGGRFAYARGRLALWTATPWDGAVGPDALAGAGLVAVANPRTAPYGAAAFETLEALGRLRGVADRLVQGESVGQAYQFVATGAADVGFVAWAQVRDQPPQRAWLVPGELHRPIVQEGVVLRGARPGARRFVDWLLGADGRRVVEAHGYAVPGEER